MGYYALASLDTVIFGAGKATPGIDAGTRALEQTRFKGLSVVEILNSDTDRVIAKAVDKLAPLGWTVADQHETYRATGQSAAPARRMAYRFSPEFRMLNVFLKST